MEQVCENADRRAMSFLRRPDEFPTPAFKIAVPLLLAAAIALAVWLLL
jgi:hypothetical protein